MRQVDVLFVLGCPNAELAVVRAREAIETAATPAHLSVVEVENAADAIAQRFLGSPSIRVNGLDVDLGARQREDFGMQCRVYAVGGRLERAPPTDWIVAALEGRGLEGSSPGEPPPG